MLLVTDRQLSKYVGFKININYIIIGSVARARKTYVTGSVMTEPDVGYVLYLKI